jgi:hypothetical protein
VLFRDKYLHLIYNLPECPPRPHNNGIRARSIDPTAFAQKGQLIILIVDLGPPGESVGSKQLVPIWSVEWHLSAPPSDRNQAQVCSNPEARFLHDSEGLFERAWCIILIEYLDITNYCLMPADVHTTGGGKRYHDWMIS